MATDHKGIIGPPMEHQESRKITYWTLFAIGFGQAYNGRIGSRLGVRNRHRLYFVGFNETFQKSHFWFFSFFFMIFFSKKFPIFFSKFFPIFFKKSVAGNK